MRSSSGGMFPALTHWILSQKGVVFGAAFDPQWQVRHCIGENAKDCQAFQGSKYVQSRIGHTYRQARKELRKGRWVLFSGTPCQIHGLKLFLGKEYEKLIVVDVACHGVPSPATFQKYIQIRQKKRGEALQSISFRDKCSGWKSYSVSFAFSHGMEQEIAVKDVYMKGFLSNLYLRPSCYYCTNKEDNYFSDLTMADYWGVEKQHPDMDDDKGTSLVLVHTAKGARLLEALQSSLRIKKVDYDQACTGNAAVNKSVKWNLRRSSFFAAYQQHPEALVPLVKRHTKKLNRWQAWGLRICRWKEYTSYKSWLRQQRKNRY